AANIGRPALRVPAARPRGADPGRLHRCSVAMTPHPSARTRRATAPHFLLQRKSESCVPSFSARLAVAATLCSCGLMRPASAQRLDAGAPPPPATLSGSTAEAYEPVFEALRRLA